MGWKENKSVYIQNYMNKHYKRFTVQFKLDDENDSKIWNELLKSKNKNKTLKELVLKGLSSK